jgi:hypothetical protein
MAISFISDCVVLTARSGAKPRIDERMRHNGVIAVEMVGDKATGRGWMITPFDIFLGSSLDPITMCQQECW